MNTLGALIAHHKDLASRALERAESYLRASAKTAAQSRPGEPAVISARMAQMTEHALKDAADHAEAFVVLKKVERSMAIHG